jgi:CheY-like chemotaxis protein
MSFPPSPEFLAHLRDDARLMVERSAAHQDHLDKLVASSDRDLHEAQTASRQASDAGADDLRHLLRGHVQRRALGAVVARQLCVSGREQHAAACGLLAQFDGEDLPGDRRATAVLVVDDYGDVRELVASILENAGFVVRTAANGLEGLIAANEMRPGVIVMDVTMPVLDGIEATRLIKAGETTRSARVIAYTANASLDSTLTQGLFSAVLHKPATPAVVLATVRHVASM